jgi:hypothetical protein
MLNVRKLIYAGVVVSSIFVASVANTPSLITNYLNIVNVDGEVVKEKQQLSICPDGMAYVHGMMVKGDSEYIEALQNSVCADWISETFPERCAKFSERRWRKIVSNLDKKLMQFCIDYYEYPNQAGAKPQVYMTWEQASKNCESISKRLCTEEEWSFACEGEDALPYPYGYERDSTACNIDQDWIQPDYQKLFGSYWQEEVDRLWKGHSSGESKKCFSPFGVYDLTGNVDEFTVSNRSTGYISILKGGYWSKVRARCRPSTRAHNQWHRNYQLGFRCCSSI